jgi:hypothetical protein
MIMSNPLATIEAAQKLLAQPDTPLAKLEAGVLELQRVIASNDADLEGLDSRRKIEMSAATPAGVLEKKLDDLDRRRKEVERRAEIASIVLSELEKRISAQREADDAERIQAAYDAVLARRSAFVRRAEELLGRVGPEFRDLMAEYHSVEQSISAANRSLPLGADRIHSIEVARHGALLPPKVSERRFQGLVHQGQLVGEMGRCEAFPHQGHWVIYKRSNAVQGDETIGPCVVGDFVEITTQRYEPVRLEALASALRVPPWSAAPPERGRVEKRTMLLADWLRMSGEPAEPVPMPVAAE